MQFQITKTIPDEELKDIFLEAIREPETTLAMFDFKNQSIDQVIDKALAMDQTHKNKKSMDMSALHNLPTVGELQF